MSTADETNADLRREIESLRKALAEQQTASNASRVAEETMWAGQIALAALVNNLPGIAYRISIGSEGHPKLEFVSKACKTLTGYSPSFFLTRFDNFREEFVHSEDREKVARLIDTSLAEHEPYELVYRVITADGELKWLCERGTGIYDPSGRLVAQEGFISDVTLRIQPVEELRLRCRELEEALAVASRSMDKAETRISEVEANARRSQRLETLGIMAGGISHDFNNILQAIIGYAKLASENVAKDGKAWGYLRRILTASDRAADLTNQILSFCSSVESPTEPVLLSPLIEEAVRMLKSSLPATVRVRSRTETEVGPILGKSTTILQTLVVLCTHVQRTMRRDGNLTVGLREVTVSEDRPSHVPPGLGPGVYAKITITDRSSDPSPLDREDAFGISAAEDSASKGGPPGLAVVEEQVREMGGLLTAVSAGRPGHCYSIYLPLCEGVPESEERQTGMEELPGGKEHLLFVDDEEMLVELGMLVAEDLGYTVTGCTSSVEALRVFRENPDRFDLIITDQTMPQMTGFELAGHMLTLRPGVPIIITTGYSEEVNELKARALGIREYLMKPITPETLAETIRRVLDRNS